RALAAVDRLSALVEALLWFAKAQSRLDDQAMEVVNLADVVRAEIAGRQRGAGAPPIVSTLPDEALVRGDERLLGRIAANLLDNAVKYGEGLSIRVRADRQASQVR